MNDANLETRDLSPVEFVDGEQLPDVCVVCGTRSSFNVEVGELNVGKGLDRQGIFAKVLGALGGAIAIQIKPAAYEKKFKLSVKLPVCQRHLEAETLKPIYVDHGQYKITIAAHKDFIAQWRNT